MSRPAEIAPSPHRFTREEYHRMGEAGLFANERVELLDGTIATMSPQGCPHAGTVQQLDARLSQATDARYRVRARLPVVLDDWSEPEPDLAVCVLEPYRYTRAHPLREQIVLVCEIASSSLEYDRTDKAAAYAASGIPEYSIVDVDHRCVHVLTQPDRAGRQYRDERTLRDGDALTAPRRRAARRRARASTALIRAAVRRRRPRASPRRAPARRRRGIPRASHRSRPRSA